MPAYPKIYVPGTSYDIKYQNNGSPAPPGIYPKNALHIMATLAPTVHPEYDNIRYYGGILAHEAGHVLGLEHTTQDYFSNNCPEAEGDPRSSIFPSAGCCGTVSATDYYHEFYPCPGSEFAICEDPNGSDNLMCEMAGCNRYLSPQQGAVMHYNLRTSLKDFLTASGYTAATQRIPAYDYTVSNTIEWWDSDKYMRGNVYVPAGKTLSITCLVSMPAEGNIVVEKGGLLVVNGGTITNISGAGWGGIQVKGDPTLPQNAANQGICWIVNGGTISNAGFGVSNHSGSSGAAGIMVCHNAVFRNNYRDIDFRGGGLGYKCQSSFVNCEFIVDGAIAKGITQPNSRIYMTNADGVKIWGCNFEYAAGSLYTDLSHCNGIVFNNSTAQVNSNGSVPSVIKGFKRGIQIINYNPILVPSIMNTSFIENEFGVFVKDAHNLILQQNTFQPKLAGTGVYLFTSKYYKVQNNAFSTPTPYIATGVAAFRSFDGAHSIYRNNFSKMLFGINCMDNNNAVWNTDPNFGILGLKMNCNDFNDYFNYYDIVLTHTTGLAIPTINQVQGNVSAPSPTNVVRNLYSGGCGNSQQWYFHPSSTITVAHGANTNSVSAITQPTPQPYCSGTPLNIVNTNIPLDYINDCPAFQNALGGESDISSEERITNLNNYITDVRASEADSFEIQSAVASKLNCFVLDTLADMSDSIIAIYDNNQGGFSDADLSAIFARIAVGDYTGALSKTAVLSGTRAQWGDFLEDLIGLEQEAEGVFALQTDPELLTTFQDWAAVEEQDIAAYAESILEVGAGFQYEPPQAFPEEELGERKRRQEEMASVAKSAEFYVRIFPNPAQDVLNVELSDMTDKPLQLDITDVCGRKIIVSEITSPTSVISMKSLQRGMYFVRIHSNNGQLVKLEKVVLE